MTRRTLHRQAGTSLVELLTAMVVTSLVLSGTFVAMTNAMNATETAKAMTGMNNNLRVAVDLMVRDLLQAGQGLPTGRVVSIPNADGADPVLRPGPPGTNYEFNDDVPTISAVTVGPDLGPDVDGQQTDMITILSADTAFDRVDLTAVNADRVVVAPTTNITDGGPDDIQEGDVIMLTKGSLSALMHVTSVSGQTIIFTPGDSLELNQYDTTLDMLGTLDQLRAAAPPDVVNAAGVVPTEATRIRMISYYIDDQTDPTNPRLIRRLNAHAGRAVAFGIENLQFTYDLTDGATNPTNVQMDDNDLDGSGACAPNPCSLNQIRKVNLFISDRSQHRLSVTDQFLRNSLATQVSLRNLAFVDRYR